MAIRVRYRGEGCNTATGRQLTSQSHPVRLLAGRIDPGSYSRGGGMERWGWVMRGRTAQPHLRY